MQKRRAAILMYHGITADPLPVYNWCHLPADEFRAQAEWLKQNYRVEPLSELVACLRENRPLPERTACITFDDAFRSVAQLAAPILESLGLPFTVFVVGSLCETGAPPWPERIFAALLGSNKESIWWNDRRCSLKTAEEREAFYPATISAFVRLPARKRADKTDRLVQLLGDPESDWTSTFSTLTREELRQLTDSGLCRLGAHSHTHEVLTTCSPDALRQELELSRQALLDTPGYMDVFAYPHGYYNPIVVTAVRECGYQGAVTTNHRLCRSSDSVFEIPRVGIRAGLPMDLFECKVLGF